VAFLVLVADRSKPPVDFAGLRRRLIWTAAIALTVSILSGIIWLLWVSADLFGAPVIEVCLQGGIWTVLGETRFGLIGSARLAVAVLLAVSLLWSRARMLQLAAAAALLALLAPMGHAGATPGLRGALHVTGDMAHLIAAGAWLGGLPAFAVLLGTPRRGGEAWRPFTVTATRRFAEIALLSTAALAATGLFNAWNTAPGLCSPPIMAACCCSSLDCSAPCWRLPRSIGFISRRNYRHRRPRGSCNAPAWARLPLASACSCSWASSGRFRPTSMRMARRRCLPTPPSSISMPAMPWPR
jgi:hypothetical protein